jgi:hypothetical protein
MPVPGVVFLKFTHIYARSIKNSLFFKEIENFFKPKVCDEFALDDFQDNKKGRFAATFSGIDLSRGDCIAECPSV